MKSKIKSLQQLKKIVKLIKYQHKSIVLANGCFDLLHVGHIRYLEGGKKLGDVLVVAINDDHSIKQVKDAKRPIMPGRARAEIVAALAAVDYVVLFREKTVENVIKALRPDIQVKGTDYTRQSVPERESVKACGGKVAITGDKKEHATKDLIQRILQKNKGKI